MPKLSCFTPLGLLKLSSKPSPAELFYWQMIAAVGEQFSTEEGTHVEASIYARAMACGRAQALIEHAGDQAWPSTILENIPAREAEYGIVPGPNDTITDRRAALAAARRLPRGAALVVLRELFGTLLGYEADGGDFIGVRCTPSAEAVNHPASLGDQPMNLQPATVERKFIRVIDEVAGTFPGAYTLRYEGLDPNELDNPIYFDDESIPIPTTRLLVGDVVVVDAETNTRTERVTITAVGFDTPGGPDVTYRTLTATFTKPHAAGFSGTTAPFPLWASSKRHYTIVLTEAAAADAETRRKVNELAARVFAGVATWSIAGGEVVGGVGSAGPFTVGGGMLGVTPIGTVVV